MKELMLAAICYLSLFVILALATTFFMAKNNPDKLECKGCILAVIVASYGGIVANIFILVTHVIGGQ